MSSFDANIVGKLTKVSKIGFCVEDFSAKSFENVSTIIIVFLIGGWLDTSHYFEIFRKLTRSLLIS